MDTIGKMSKGSMTSEDHLRGAEAEDGIARILHPTGKACATQLKNHNAIVTDSCLYEGAQGSPLQVSHPGAQSVEQLNRIDAFSSHVL